MSNSRENSQGESNISHQEGGINIGRDLIAHGANLIGRDGSIVQNLGVSPDEYYSLFKPLFDMVSQAPTEVKEQAKEKVEMLLDETSKGEKADDGKMASIINGIVELIPGAIGTIVSMFASPILGSFVGPVTKIVLQKLGPNK